MCGLERELCLRRFIQMLCGSEKVVQCVLSYTMAFILAKCILRKYD